VALIEPFYPTGKRGRPPIGIERMLRLYLEVRTKSWTTWR
jgi:IS5 family transposase